VRNKYWLAGLLLLLIGVFVMWHRRDTTDKGSASTAANTGVSSPAATLAGSGASAGAPTQAAPPAEPPPGDVAQATNDEAAKPIDANAMRGAQPKAARVPSTAKSADADQQENPAVAESQGASSDGGDSGTTAQQTPAPTAPPPPIQMGMLLGRLHNSVGSSLRLTKISYFVDGSEVATQSFPSGLARGADVPVFERRVALGDHTLGALVEYQGNGEVFSYFEGYHYKVSASHPFTATANTSTQVTVTSFEKGDALTSFENRLGVGFRIATAGSK
jgi:hypothetical protein